MIERRRSFGAAQELPAGQPVILHWDVTASDDRSVVVRWGWDVTNWDDYPWDPWHQSWCTTCRAAPSRAFRSGSHGFTIEAQDSEGETTLARIHASVIPMAVEPTSWTQAKLRLSR